MRSFIFFLLAVRAWAAVSHQSSAAEREAVAADDECDTAECALHVLQVRGVAISGGAGEAQLRSFHTLDRGCVALTEMCNTDPALDLTCCDALICMDSIQSQGYGTCLSRDPATCLQVGESCGSSVSSSSTCCAGSTCSTDTTTWESNCVWSAPHASPVWLTLAKASSPMCLSTDGNRIENGVKVQLWGCDLTGRSTGQKFILDSVGRIRMAADQSYCVVIDGDDYVDGAKIQLWKCNEHNIHQTWSLDSLPGQISNMGSFSNFKSYCLVVDGNHGFNGAKIQLWGCAVFPSSSAAKQSWATNWRPEDGMR